MTNKISHETQLIPTQQTCRDVSVFSELNFDISSQMTVGTFTWTDPIETRAKVDTTSMPTDQCQVATTQSNTCIKRTSVDGDVRLLTPGVEGCSPALSEAFDRFDTAEIVSSDMSLTDLESRSARISSCSDTQRTFISPPPTDNVMNCAF